METLEAPYFSVPVSRGCGTRKKGGIYIDVGAAPEDCDDAAPLSNFLVDSPVPVDDWTISPRGMTYTERDGVFHLIDWVGYRYYPNPCDFYEEVCRYGLSRRIPIGLDFSKLTKDSKILLIHAKAYLENLNQLVGEMDEPPTVCLTGRHENPLDALDDENPPNQNMCCSFWWKYCKGASSGTRKFTQDTIYPAQAPPEGFKPEFRPALFMVMPATSLVVVGDDQKSDDAYSKVAIAKQNGLHVNRAEK